MQREGVKTRASLCLWEVPTCIPAAAALGGLHQGWALTLLIKRPGQKVEAGSERDVLQTAAGTGRALGKGCSPAVGAALRLGSVFS